MLAQDFDDTALGGETALRALRRGGIPEERAMFFSGHRTANTFRRYDVTGRDNNREGMQRATE